MNVFAKIGSAVLSPVTFLREVNRELQAVTWPTRAGTLKATAIVIGSSVLVGIYIALLDLGFAKGMQALLSLKN